MSQRLLYDIFQAYFDARSNKRTTDNALKFEMDFESRLLGLYDDIVGGTYRIARSICFISFHPVKREIFAGDFRDRVVHHLIFNYLSPIFERIFINDVYSCRIGKGTSYGIRRLDHHIRSCSENYSRDCYVLKLDISGYFMSIDRRILYRKITETLAPYRETAPFDFALVDGLIRQVVFNDPVKNCCIKGNRSDWSGLPKSKSLFFAEPELGLPIGNLTSQLFGNLHLDGLDHFVTGTLGCRHYGRYVDDFFIVHTDREYLKSLVPRIRDFLASDAGLELHPKKISLQHVNRGVPFLGAYLKPYRTYVGNRTKNASYRRIAEWNERIFRSPTGNFDDPGIARKFLSSVNSYLGIMGQFHTYRLRRKLLRIHADPDFWKRFRIVGDFGKVAKRGKIRKRGKIPKR
jgi:hypothetical protein